MMMIDKIIKLVLPTSNVCLKGSVSPFLQTAHSSILLPAKVLSISHPSSLCRCHHLWKGRGSMYIESAAHSAPATEVIYFSFFSSHLFPLKVRFLSVLKWFVFLNSTISGKIPSLTGRPLFRPTGSRSDFSFANSCCPWAGKHCLGEQCG